MTSFVEQYIYNNLNEGEQEPKLKGGYPLHLFSESQCGGNSTANREQFAELSIPIGLVMIREQSNEIDRHHYDTDSYINEPMEPMDDARFDKLFGCIATVQESKHHNSTKKNMPKKDNHTKKSR